ncbi:carbon-nitrogen hydrolase family protein [Liberiplasma polymorphum]|uniref:carbon-nitrogen hydrolase family protein n=1 Tax=Liberiplasma polymorphum TaxID=3374570 RepID=UPI003775D87E
MKVGFCQFDIKYKDVIANLETIVTMLNEVDLDLVVLPELALTGYYFENKEQLMQLSSDTINGNVIDRLTQVAALKKMTIIIGLAEVSGNDLYNTAYIINRNGVVGKHRKMHLTNNETIFKAGNQVEVFEVDGMKIGIAICFDTWFPEIFRVLSNKGADIICCPANFGGPWTLDVVKVRALENSIPVILSNRLGSEIIKGEKDYFRGESMVIDGFGNLLIKAGDQPYVGTVDIDLKAYSRNKSLICDEMINEKNKYDKL